MLKFGTSGVRALVSDLTDQNVYLMTTAFLDYAGSIDPKISEIYTAIDLRESSSKILAAIQAAIADHGQKSYYCGEVPTPCLANYALAKKSPAIMVTGSHIPADRNGIKFYLPSGETLKQDDSQILANYQKLLTANFKSELFDSLGRFKNPVNSTTVSVEADCKHKFEIRYLNFFGTNALKNIKIVFYEHSSVARSIFPALLEKLGASVISAGRTSSFVAVDTEAVESVGQFGEWIKQHSADALVSTDGDADRPLVIDNTGAVVPGDTLGMLTCECLNIEAVALPVSCNSSISQMQCLKEVRFTKIGSPYVVDELNDLAKHYEKVAGFEANGGFILKSSLSSLDQLPTRDSLLPIICTLKKISESGKLLSEIVKEINKRYTASILVKNCPLGTSHKILEKVSSDPVSVYEAISGEKASQLDINKLDGVRVSGPRYVVHFRPSGNAPEFRCYTEADTAEQAQTVANNAKKFIENFIRNF
jgi:phosphomannomutase